MTHEESRELEILSAAEAYPIVRTRYSFQKDPELAATARRLGREPGRHMIQVAERPTLGGSATHVIKSRESGRVRLRELRLKRVNEQL